MTHGESGRNFEMSWQGQARGHSAHHVDVDPEKGVVLQGDGWGVAYAALAIHGRDGSDGRVLASTRLRHQQARCSEVVGDAVMVATDSRLFRLDRESLEPLQDWSTRVPRYTNTMVSDGNLMFMANWLRPKGRVFDLDSGQTRAIAIGSGIAVLDRGRPVLGMRLDEGTVHEIDIRNARHRVIARTEPGLGAALIDRRWLWLLAGRWAPLQGVHQPPDASVRLSLWDLKAGRHVHDVRIPNPAMHTGVPFG